MSIDPHAFVHPAARIGPGVAIGPFSVVEAGAVIGAGCRIASRVTIKSGVTLGRENQVCEGAVLGGAPQHLETVKSPGPVSIGDRNILRENSTVHRAMTVDGQTSIGDDCLLMVAAHVAHDCRVGNRVVLTNNVMLAGHVAVGDRAYLGGGAAVHQFCRVGAVAMVGGMARVPQDVPPYVMVDGGSGLVVGLNRVGLRRAGFDRHDREQIKQAYQLIYRSGLPLEQRLATLEAEFADGPAAAFAPFLHESARGVTRERRTPPGATIRVVHEADDAAAEQRKAG